MDITWLGHAATRARTRTAAVVMDPYDRSVGGTMGRPDAHIVTISHDDPVRNGLAGVAPANGDPMVLNGPGEYEIRGVIVEGIPSTLAASAGDAAARKSTLFVFEADGLKWAHLGGMGTAPAAGLLDPLVDVDIIIVPIAMPDTLPPAEAARAIRPVEPRIVIPVGYDPADQDALRAFVTALGAEPDAPVSRFTINRSPSGDGTQVVVLEARA
jgi:L-ascorbate metabolism protein UlaG (beta-lactamase superfamily)